MGVEPVSIAVEIAATGAAASIGSKIGGVVRRRECRRQLAENAWRELTKRSGGRLSQGYLDPDTVWNWTNEPDVRKALLAGDPTWVRHHGGALREAWRTRTYDARNPLTDDDGRLLAEIIFYLLVVDVLAGDELLSTYASRILDSVRNVHNDLALVCVTLSQAHESPRDRARRRLAIVSDGVISAADRGLRDRDGTVIVIERDDEEQQLVAAVDRLAERSALVVTGQPDVGKSHLAMRVVRQLRQSRDVFAFDLRRHHVSLTDIGTALAEAGPAGGPGAPAIVVIDGAEAVQKHGTEGFYQLVEQALALGACVIAIGRSDAIADIQDALARSGVQPTTHDVAGLSRSDLATASQRIPAVDSLLVLPVGRWLARRPGLLQAWLVLEPATPIQNEGHLVDLLRRQYIGHADPGRAGRLAAVSRLARAELGGESGGVDPGASDQLRASGVLLGRENSWDTALRFADDLWRDAALAGLIAQDPAVLIELIAARSALRAARLACQLRLNADLASIGTLVDHFDDVAAHTGQARWGEVPFEALTSLGGSREEWRQLLGSLETRGALERFLSTARRTHGSLLSEAPAAMAGLIDALLDRTDDDPAALSLLRTWLQAAALDTPAENIAARQRACAHLLGHPPPPYDERARREWLNDIATCGADLNGAAIDQLRTSVRERPDDLDGVFADPRSGYALSRSHPDLLLELAEVYYVVGGEWSHEALRCPTRGMAEPRFGVHHTPFVFLLQTRPLESLAAAARILDAACAQSVSFPWHKAAEAEPAYVRMDLPKRGATELLTSDGAWTWYRGGLAAPASAVSILLAVERFADRLVVAGRTVDHVTGLLLRTARSVPLVGLCVGLALRHLRVDSPSEAWLCWIAQRVVWDLEIDRATEERLGYGFVQNNDVASEQLRVATVGDPAQQVAAASVLRGDTGLIETLEAASRALERAADGDPFIRGRAFEFRPSAMHVEVEDGRLVIQMQVPADIIEATTAAAAEHYLDNLPHSIAMRYAVRDRLEPATDRMAADLATCQSDDASDTAWAQARVNVAAAALRAAFIGEAPVPAADLLWAADEVLGYVSAPAREPDNASAQMWSPVLAVASALPALRLASTAGNAHPFGDDLADRVAAVSLQLAQTGGSRVLYTMLATHASRWKAPCSTTTRDECPNLVVEQLMSAVLQRSVHPTVSAEYGPHDPERASRFIQTDLLLAPLAFTAAETQLCDHVTLEGALVEALDLHAEAFCPVGRPGHVEGDHFPRVGDALFALSLNGRTDRVAAYIQRLAPNYQCQALRGIRQVAGDHANFRPRLEEIWPGVMQQLDGVLAHADRLSDPHAELVPNVAVDSYTLSNASNWNDATSNWINPRSVESALAEWALNARGCGHCAAALGSFLLTADTQWLVATGVPLLHELVSTVEVEHLRDRAASWLADLPDMPVLSNALRGNAQFLAIVDRYVQADDFGAMIARRRMDPGERA
jgi:hypothetical protein